VTFGTMAMLPIAAMPPMSVAFAGPEPPAVAAGSPACGVLLRGTIGGGLIFPAPIIVVAAGATFDDGFAVGFTSSTGASLTASRVAFASARLRTPSSIAARASSGRVEARVVCSSAAPFVSMLSAALPGSGGEDAFASSL
jgi:hypothetical protein